MPVGKLKASAHPTRGEHTIMKSLHRSTLFALLLLVTVAGHAQASELALQGNRLVVAGVLDGSAVQTFVAQLAQGNVKTVVFEDSVGGTADAARQYAAAIRASGVDTELIGQCFGACAYAFLAGRNHRFGHGPQVNVLLIPVAGRPKASELADRWRGERAEQSLAEFVTPTANHAPGFTAAPIAAPRATPISTVPDGAAAPADRWQPEHGVLFTATPTLFGRIYNSYYCDGTQGSDLTRCELLSDADPFKLGVLSP